MTVEGMTPVSIGLPKKAKTVTGIPTLSTKVALSTTGNLTSITNVLQIAENDGMS
jgi:hypothetical protein